MKQTLEVRDRKLASVKTLRREYGISWSTLDRWKKMKFVSPVRLGRANYYDVQEVENRLLTGE